MISTLWPPAIGGGAEAHAGALAERLRGRGHEVAAVTFGVASPDVVGEVKAWPYRLDEHMTQGAARRLAFHALDVYRPATTRVMRTAVKRFSPDVVHTHAVSGLSSAALSEPSRLGVAHVHTAHDYWLLCQRSSMTRRDGSSCEVRCRGCRAVSAARNAIIRRHPPHVVLAVSRFLADMHTGLQWFDERVRLAPHPVDTRDVALRGVRPERPMTFGYLGRLTREKGVTTLLAAFGAALLGDARLVIAGDGPLRGLVTAHRDPRIVDLGWVDGPAKDAFFASIDCLVVPSQWREPAGLVVNEARGVGLPVIAARAGGLPELVPPASTPLLFPPGDATALARRLEEFARSPNAFLEHGGGAGQTWDAYLDLVEHAYEDAIRASSSEPALGDVR